jgi:hypothetical protein
MKSPQELIEHVVSVVQQKVAKNMKCFYSIKINKNEATTELIERKAAGDEFASDIQNIISLNKPEDLIIELYKGSSRKVKSPESQYYIPFGGREISFPVKVEPLGCLDNSTMYSEMRRNFDQQLQGVRDLAGLHTSLTISQIELKQAQNKVAELQADLKEAEEYIERLESDRKKNPSLSGAGGLNLVEIGSYWLEGILRRNPGIIAGTLGMTDDQAKGLFTTTSATTQPQGKATATIEEQGANKQLTEREKTRVEVVENLAGFLRQLSDYHLRCVYDLLCEAGKDLNTLEKMMLAIGLELPKKETPEQK